MAKNFGKDKKGSILDLLYMGGVLLFFGFIVLIGFTIQSKLNDNIQTIDDIPTEAKTASSSLTNHYTGVLDTSALFLAVILGVSALILAAMVRVHPIFIPAYLILLAFVIMYSMAMSNIYQAAASNTELIAYADQLSVTTAILTWLPIIVTIFGGLLMIIMYKSWQSANE